ncbi:hypothetical protein GGG17_02495 [Arsenicicoccus sp. MKL-02]|uniref:Uncharacterized protein n=1 Tax=Arsenicicoccus cauae TaxID=2663847 RepID=A0A6I3ILM1_9MICO|nr:hypothetical protein [Arsenicicoccus cauae]MTB70860.1 hypothetical protein [Arsenicicoccus cauae]
MASAYPHMIFATEAAGLDKDRLVALLDEAVPGGSTEQTALKLTWTRDGYAYTYWFEDADRVGEMYADYLPEGARRRPVINATTVIDMSGAADASGEHADEARGIVEHLAAQDGVHVFAESTKRFVGLSYGDEPAPEPAPTATAAIEPASVTPEPVQPDPVVEVAEPTAGDFGEPGLRVDEPSEDEVVAQPTTPQPAATPEHQPGDFGEPGLRVDEPSEDELAYPTAPEPAAASAPAPSPEPEPAPTPVEPIASEPEVTPEPVVPEPVLPEPEIAPEPPVQPERIPGQLPSTPEPTPTPHPLPDEEPAPTPGPEPALSPEPAPAPEATPSPEPTPEPQPLPRAEPIAQPEPIPAPEPVPEKGFLKKLFGRR